MTEGAARSLAQADLLATALHDLRGPLGVIAGYAQMLDEAGRADASNPGELVTALRESIDALTQLIAQIGVLADLERGTHTLTAVDATVDAFLQPLTEEPSPDPALSLMITGTAGDSRLRADPALLRDAIRALAADVAAELHTTEAIHLHHLAGDGDSVRLLIGPTDAVSATCDHGDDRPERSGPSSSRSTVPALLGARLIELHGGWVSETTTRIRIVELPMAGVEGDSRPTGDKLSPPHE